ncbi:hypothetical protein WH91_12520 [Devosia psychrophila]|uniref:Uncharacterized protein n=1 Tax=Devosia psychrophila TaxID=728005 RepID=A0ABR5DXD4_9HYPH|nr:hypothetical protein [Devosia psychrophila]KKC32650.1 hypothetical protein WH91_12520 [Devosia psychrophila]
MTSLIPARVVPSVAANQSPPEQLMDGPVYAAREAIVCGQLVDAIAKYKLLEANALGTYQRDSCWLIDKGDKLLVIGRSDVDSEFVLARLFRSDGNGSEDAWTKLIYLQE